MNHRPHAHSLEQAVQESPALSRLAELARDSQSRLRAIKPLLPPGLRPGLKAGPIEDLSWCLIVNNNATAAKIRQLLPIPTAHLHANGWPQCTIRLKVHAS